MHEIDRRSLLKILTVLPFVPIGRSQTKNL